MPKAVITKTKDHRGDLVVRVAGVRIGTATHNRATKDSPASWTLWVDTHYQIAQTVIRAASAAEVRGHAEALFERSIQKDSI